MNWDSASHPVRMVLDRLKKVGRAGNEWKGLCPAHDDKKPSLTIGQGNDGRVLVRCWNGCSYEAIMAAIGLTEADGFPAGNRRAGTSHAKKITLRELADAKGLPEAFLVDCGVQNHNRGVIIHYYQADGTEAPRHRLRTCLVASKGSEWTGPRGAKGIVPYGLEHGELARQQRELTLVEGESDALTLRLHGLPSLGIPGCEQAGVLMLEHLSGIERVYVVKEPDHGGEQFVRGIQNRLTEIRWKGKAYLIPMPKATKDLNDLFRQAPGEFATAFTEFRRQAQPFVVPKSNDQSPSIQTCEENGLIHSLAAAIKEEHHFAKLGPVLYHHENGVYRPAGIDIVEQEVKDLVNRWRRTSKWNAGLGHQVAAYLGIGAPQLPDVPELHRVNVLNGIIDVRTGELTPHDPSFLSIYQLPVDFDAGAVGDRWQQFAAEVFPADSQDLAFEIPGLLMVPYVGLQKAFLLYGPEGTGKSTYLQCIEAFLGADSVSSISLSQIEEKFHAYGLVGKLANITGELNFKTVNTTKLFKEIVGGDRIQVEKKNVQPFSYRPFARLLFATNQLPKVREATPSFYKRWVIIPCTQHHRDTDHQVLSKSEELTTPEALSGLLNLALAGLRRLLDNQGVTQSASTRAALVSFKAKSDPLSAFLGGYVKKEAGTQIRKGDFHQRYNQFRLHLGLCEETPESLGRQMKARQMEDRQSTQPDGTRPAVYAGYRLLDEAA